jgi:hypothetical protein
VGALLAAMLVAVAGAYAWWIGHSLFVYDEEGG